MILWFMFEIHDFFWCKKRTTRNNHSKTSQANLKNICRRHGNMSCICPGFACSVPVLIFPLKINCSGGQQVAVFLFNGHSGLLHFFLGDPRRVAVASIEMTAGTAGRRCWGGGMRQATCKSSVVVWCNRVSQKWDALIGWGPVGVLEQVKWYLTGTGRGINRESPCASVRRWTEA